MLLRCSGCSSPGAADTELDLFRIRAFFVAHNLLPQAARVVCVCHLLTQAVALLVQLRVSRNVSLVSRWRNALTHFSREF